MPNTAFLNDSFTHLDLILATSEIGIWELDAQTGKAVRNLRHDQIFGHDTLLEDWGAEIFLGYVIEADRERVSDLLKTSLENGKPWSFETRIRRADGVDRWISAKGTPTFSETGEVVKLIGHVIDITETKQNEDRLKLLSKELNHRVANTFAIMNSMIRHASRKATSVDDFAATLMERLGALARANRVLVAEEAERSSLRDILNMALATFAGWQERISITGKADIWFSGEASEALAMIFHELLTNAVKHGALAVPNGQVAVDISAGNDRAVFIKWTETGGPAVATERRTGIGTTILQNAMRDEGDVEIDFSPQGVVCGITVNHGFQREVPEKPPASSAPPPVDLRFGAADACAGLRIMIVEDDPIIGMDLAEIFRSRGATVLGPYTSVASAVRAVRETPDIALLDVNLGQETTDVVASRLSEISIPFLVISGQIDSSDMGPAYNGAQIVSKPFGEQELVRQVIELAAAARA